MLVFRSVLWIFADYAFLLHGHLRHGNGKCCTFIAASGAPSNGLGPISLSLCRISSAIRYIKVYESFDSKRLVKLQPDYVVVGNAMSREPEVEWLLEQSAQKLYFFAGVNSPIFISEQISHRRYGHMGRPVRRR